MTNQTETTHKFGTRDLPENFDYVANGGRVPSLTGDLRHLIPKLGLREYWYPLCGAGRVKKNKPLRVRMLGEDICIFQGKAKGETLSKSQLAAEMRERDQRDSTRADAPLSQAPDAVYLDTTLLGIAEVEEAILKIVRSRVTNGRDFS